MKVITYSRPRKDLDPVSESGFSKKSEYVQPEISGNSGFSVSENEIR